MLSRDFAMTLRRPAYLLLLTAAILSGCSVGRSTELTYHSYVHNPSGRIHYVLHLADYERGLFFGSCGPSTRSLQWEYTIELAGPGPSYGRNEIEVTDGNLRRLPVASGGVTLDPAKRTAAINLVVSGPETGAFRGNGTFLLRQQH